MNPNQVPWFLQTQAQQMSNAPQMFTANPQAQVNQPIDITKKAPVEPGPARPTATQAKSVTRSLAGNASDDGEEEAPSGLGSYLSPRAQDQQSLQGLREAQAQAKLSQSAELSGLSDYINNLAGKKPDINWTPIAAYLDSKNGSKYTASAQAMAGMSQDDRDKMIFGLKEQLMKGHQAMAKGELDSLKQETQMQQFREHQDELARNHKAMEAAALQRGSALDGRNITAKDAQAQRAAEVFDKHPIITNALNRYNQIALDRHTLENTEMITPQIMDELSQGIATALAGGRSAGLGMSEKQELQNIQKDFANLKQYSGKPMNALSPENRQMLLSLFDRLQDGYGNILASQAETLRKGRQFAHNPTALAVMDDKVKEYQSYRKQKSSETTSDGPPVGFVSKGHKFKGGDAHDPKNWELVE